ncbi:MAG: hypothetical protein K2Y05_07435 [Hyphomicrobiaceae bacterium]|nr:hypothetical protein [Hyphomicrobiaceae bacterium]
MPTAHSSESSFLSQSSEFIGVSALARVVSAYQKRHTTDKAVSDLAARDTRELVDIGLNRFEIVSRVKGQR